ncbi:MAG TPA: recombination protein RecR [Lentisphaeria bacterium]|nr:MAG: recombination protein RecR [Lentisphaerae bacterium GWF2_38_69]HBM16301.1 recombination protein RecR [Lentisphaeria bacterium]
MKISALPKEIENIISFFKEIPGIGRKGAERMIFAMLKWPPEKLTSFGNQIALLPEKVKKCSVCSNISESDICPICASHERDRSLLCIVEDFTQIPLLETANYKGLYFVLEGKLSPLDGITPDSLKINRLTKLISDSQNLKEVIIAVSQDIEGQATSIYLSGIIRKLGKSVTTLARGIPAGADISFANSATLAAAIEGRITIN